MVAGVKLLWIEGAVDIKNGIKGLGLKKCAGAFFRVGVGFYIYLFVILVHSQSLFSIDHDIQNRSCYRHIVSFYLLLLVLNFYNL